MHSWCAERLAGAASLLSWKLISWNHCCRATLPWCRRMQVHIDPIHLSRLLLGLNSATFVRATLPGFDRPRPS